MRGTGDERSFRPEGIGRYFTGAFLVVWLAGWAIGEVVALLFSGPSWFRLPVSSQRIFRRGART